MGFNMNVTGISEKITILETFDKDVAKTLKKEMRAGANEVAKVSRSLLPSVPLSNWGPWIYSRDGRDLGYQGSKVKSRVTVETYRSRMSGVTIAFGYRVGNWSPAGSVYELAGSIDKSGDKFNALINSRHGAIKPKQPRTLVPAYYKAMPTAQARIEAAIEAAARKASD